MLHRILIAGGIFLAIVGLLTKDLVAVSLGLVMAAGSYVFLKIGG